ncbi:MAG: sortase [Clostridia bacterium]|nr:sortase [Clostridia bacterium]
MLKRKENKNNSKGKKSQLIIVGSLLIIVGIVMVGGKYIYTYLLDKKEDIKIEEFYEVQEKIDDEIIATETPTEEKQEESKQDNTNYIAVIKIPKIGLEKGLCEKDSYCNNVNRNIQILKESTYPDIANGNFILAGHSGTGRISYFKNLYKLLQDDEVSIFYQGKEYKYKVVNMYDIEKTGTANIIRNKEKTTLTLITCRHNTNKQIVVICELVETV